MVWPSKLPARRRLLNYYLNCIQDVDRHILSVLDEVNALGLLENTIVMLIDLREELAKGTHESRIRDLFNESFAAHHYRVRWENAKSRPDKSWFLENLNSFIALFIGSIVGGISVGIFRRKQVDPWRLHNVIA